MEEGAAELSGFKSVIRASMIDDYCIRSTETVDEEGFDNLFLDFINQEAAAANNEMMDTSIG